jgi:hypothetical protein
LDTLGDVDTYDDTTAPAPTVTAGTSTATDGSSAAQVSLASAGASASNGASRTYKVVAFSVDEDSLASATDTGYRSVGALTYQWRRSSGDSDADYSDIAGATASTYDDTAAPLYTVNAPTSVAVEAQSSSVLRVTFSGASITDGAGRYYYCVVGAAGASSQNSTSNRGYRTDTMAASGGYEIFSDAEADGAFATSEGVVDSSPFDDTGLPPATQNFYKVRAQSTTGTWSSLSTTYDGAFTLANTKAITAFTVPGQTGSTTINETAHTIALTMPYGTNVTALVPAITITGVSVSPASGVARNFSTAQTYTVTAENSSTQAYTVTVTVALNPAKSIIAFTIPGQTGSTTINETAHTVALTLPYGTSVTALVPTITTTGSSVSPASGVAHNFATPQTYTVTAADSTTQAYVVTVSIGQPKATLITLRAKSGGVKIHVSGGTKTLKPFRSYKGTIWARQVRYSSTNSRYILLNAEAFQTGSIKFYSNSGKLIQTVKPFGDFASLGMKADIVYQPSSGKVYLVISLKKTGYTARVYEVTKKGLVGVANVTAVKKTSPGTILVSFLKLYGNDYGLTTMKSGSSKTVKIWRYSTIKKTWVQDKSSATRAKVRVIDNRVVLR